MASTSRARDAPKVFCTSAIISHSWDANSKRVAFVPNTKDIVVFQANGDDSTAWKFEQTLSQHDHKVLGLDWGKKLNRLLSCSEDRTAYVWELKGQWTPTLVHLGSAANRAALCCKWSPDENKFAVGSGAKTVCICYFEPEQNWWVSKHIKHHKSSVTAVAWNPATNSVIATGSTDQTVRVFSAYIKNVDGTGGHNPGKFGTILAEIPTSGWVKSLEWSPDGTILAFCGHDSVIGFADAGQDYKLTVIKTRFLPFKCIIFVNDNTLLAACNDCWVYVYSKKANKWALTGRLNVSKAKTGGASEVRAAMERFQREATTGVTTCDKELNSRHQNTISDIRVMVPGDNWKVSTSGLDGEIYVWSSKDVEAI